MEGLERNLSKDKISLENTRDGKKNGRTGHWGAWRGHPALPPVRGTERNNPPSRGPRMGRNHLCCPIPASHPGSCEAPPSPVTISFLIFFTTMAVSENSVMENALEL